MKKLRCVLYASILFCFVGTAIFMAFMPDTIPAHYNMAGEADRFGSKYESLIWPVCAAVMGCMFLFPSKLPRGENAKSGEKVLLYAGICMVLFFTAMGFYFMAKSVRYDPVTASGADAAEILRFSGIAAGVLLVLLGNIMPKARRNALFGLRTKWSMANDHVWRKSQRFGGFASVAGGLCVIAASVFASGMPQVLLTGGVIVLWLALCIVASYRFFRQDVQENGAPPG